MVTSFTNYQEVTIDELHKVWKQYYANLYNFSNFVDNFKTLFHLRVTD